MTERETLPERNIIALIYDFDGTLTPLPMQEYTLLPEFGINDAAEFWKQTNSEAKRLNSDPILSYMRHLLENAAAKNIRLTRRFFADMARKIRYYAGVESWFDRINAYVSENSRNTVKIRHYLISSGNKEILEGCSIREKFLNVFANEYYYNNGVAAFPAVVVNDTTKTQFLFRINKGREILSESVNEHMPERERPIPFENMLYIGDGITDVPCMAVVRQAGGHSIAVYNPEQPKSREICRSLFRAGRINYFAAADYTPGSRLEKQVTLLLDLKIARIKYCGEINACKAD